MTLQTARFVRFIGMSGAVSVLLCAIGWVTTRRLAGPEGLPAMALGCGIGFASAVAAGVLLVSMAAETPEAKLQRAFLALLARLTVAVALGTAAVLSGEVSSTPLLIWIAVAYVGLLPLEVRLGIV